MSTTKEMVNHPKHYNGPSGVECIDVISWMPFALGSFVKYLWRYQDKDNPPQDLKKARFYINQYAEDLKQEDYRELVHSYIQAGFFAWTDTSIRLIHKHAEWLESEGYTWDSRIFLLVAKYLSLMSIDDTIDRLIEELDKIVEDNA